MRTKASSLVVGFGRRPEVQHRTPRPFNGRRRVPAYAVPSEGFWRAVDEFGGAVVHAHERTMEMGQTGKCVSSHAAATGFADIDLPQHTTPSLTGVRMRLYETGATAVALLLENVADARVTPAQAPAPSDIAPPARIRQNLSSPSARMAAEGCPSAARVVEGRPASATVRTPRSGFDRCRKDLASRLYGEKLPCLLVDDRGVLR